MSENILEMWYASQVDGGGCRLCIVWFFYMFSNATCTYTIFRTLAELNYGTLGF
jgi:hypothetical protein